MLALVRCLFAHPSASGAQPTHKSLFYDAFLRRPAPQSRPAPRGSVETTVVAAGSGPTARYVRYHAVDYSPPLPGCRLSVGSPKPWRPRCPLAEGLSDLGPVCLPSLRRNAVRVCVVSKSVLLNLLLPARGARRPKRVLDELDAWCGGYRVHNSHQRCGQSVCRPEANCLRLFALAMQTAA